MFLPKPKHVCLFLSLAAFPQFDAMAGKRDLLLKGATTPVRMSSTVRMSFSSHPASHSVIGPSNMPQRFLKSSYVSSAYLENGPNTRQNRVAGGLLEHSECNTEEKEALPYVLVPDATGGATITFGPKTTLRQYLDDVTLTEEWESIKNASRDLDKKEYYKTIKKYPLVEENARHFWNFILSLQGSRITRGELNEELQKVAQKAELHTREEDAFQMLEIIKKQRIGFENLLTFNKQSLRSLLDELREED